MKVIAYAFLITLLTYFNIESVANILTRAGIEGIINSTIDTTSDMIKTIHESIEDIKSLTKFICHVCNELHVCSISSIQIKQTKLSAAAKPICSRCIIEINQNNVLVNPTPLIFSMHHENSMNPFYSNNVEAMQAYHLLPRLSELESMLIAKAQPIMKVSCHK